MNVLSKYIDDNTVIQCPTPELAKEIGKLLKELGIPEFSERWGFMKKYEKGFCMSFEGGYCYAEWYKSQGYEVIQASDILHPKGKNPEIINNYSIF